MLLTRMNVGRIRGFLRYVQSKSQRLDHRCGATLISSCSSTSNELKSSIGHETEKLAQLSAERKASAYVLATSPLHRALIMECARRWRLRTYGSTPIHLLPYETDKSTALQAINDNIALLFPQIPNLAGIVPIVFGNSKNDLVLFKKAQELGGVGVIVSKSGGKSWVPAKAIPCGIVKSNLPYGLGMREAIPEIIAFLRKRWNVMVSGSASP